MKAALNVGWQVLICCSVIRRGSKIGRAGEVRSPPAVQSTWTLSGRVGNGAVRQLDLVHADLQHAAQPHDVGHCLQLVDLRLADGRAAVHRRAYIGIEPKQAAVRLEPVEDLVDGRRVRGTPRGRATPRR